MKTPPPGRLLAPSLLSADFAALGAAIASVEGEAGLLHVDVMDGHFVPNLTIGPPVVAALRKATALPLDCHLMVEAPDRLLAAFAAAGADLVSVHVESCPHLHRTLQTIREAGMAPGVALNPATPVESLSVILPEADFVLVMSVNPGFGGQRFLPLALDKVRALRAMREARGLSFAIEVDGGVSPETLPALVAAGADWLVAGSAVFGAADPRGAARQLREALVALP
ncbi:MAG: ribulose-phosphate 3-epimerase [Acidobacteriota bacterium]